MKISHVVLIFALVTSLTTQAQVDFPFTGKLEIEHATYYWNGGSVSAVLLDSEGNRGYVHYTPLSWTDAPDRNKLTFRLNPKDKGVILPRGSNDEKQLLKYIRGACITSFGSVNPELLTRGKRDQRGPNAHGDFWNRMPMGRLLFKFAEKQVKLVNEQDDLQLLNIRREALISSGLGEAHPDIIQIDKLIKLLKK